MLGTAVSALAYRRANPALGAYQLKMQPNAAHRTELVERLAACYAQQKGVEVAEVYRATGEWGAIIEAGFRHKTAAEIGESLSTMFLADMQTMIGANYSARKLNTLSPKGVLKELLLKRGVHEDLATWRTLIDGSDVRELAAPAVGSMWGFEVDGVLTYPGVCRAHYFADRMANLLRGDTVVEIGGGYGELAYRFMRKAKPGVRYVIFDLPEILMRSAWFLMNALPEKRFALSDTWPTEDFDIALLPNYLLPKFGRADLVVNTRSLSEMSKETVDEYMQQIGRLAPRYFLHENSNEALLTYADHVEVPARDFKIPAGYRRIYAQKSPWAATSGRYVEYLFERSI